MLTKFFAVLIALLMLAGFVSAQSTNATITGRITDQSKAALAGVRIVVTNVDTGEQRTSATGSEGLYTIPLLNPGSYKLELEKTGFRSIVKPDVVLHLQDVATINFEMAVGTVSESITVEAGAPMINTTDASVSTVVDQTYVKNMPLSGRSFQDLILLTPGVTTQMPQPTGPLAGLKSRSSGSLPSGFEARVRKLVEQAELRRN